MSKKRRRAKKRRQVGSVEAGGQEAAASPAESGIDPEPEPRARTAAPRPGLWAGLFIAAFLLYQIAMPLRYYLGDGGYDERFSWRMFSTVRLQRCKASVEETTSAGSRRVDLKSVLHIAWVRILERGRPSAIEKVLERRCQESDVSEVLYELRCTDPAGDELPARKVALDCATGRFDKAWGDS